MKLNSSTLSARTGERRRTIVWREGTLTKEQAVRSAKTYLGDNSRRMFGKDEDMTVWWVVIEGDDGTLYLDVRYESDESNSLDHDEWIDSWEDEMTNNPSTER